MPVGGNQAFLCLSFASHEGRRWVRVYGHILALYCTGQADKTVILYSQAVLLTFFKQYFDLNLTLSYSVCCCTVPMAIITPHIIAVIGPYIYIYIYIKYKFWRQVTHAASHLYSSSIVVFPRLASHLSKDLRCSYFYCSFPRGRQTKRGPLYSFNSNNGMFLDNPVCLSVPR